MHVRVFAIPALDGEAATDELNRFLAAHRVIAIDRELVHDGTNSFWAVSVTVVSPESRPPAAARGSIDYKDVLNEADFALFVQLRSLRKAIADRDGVPSYALFTNEQLADMVRGRVTTATDLRGLRGVGEGRVRKYGEPFLQVLRGEVAEHMPPDGDDNGEA